MRSIHTIIALGLVLLITSSCYKRNTWGIRGKGSEVTETRAISGFDRINLSIDGDVEYTQDSTFRVEVSGQANILEVLTTEVKSSELRISYRRNVWQHDDIHIRVYSPYIKGLSISGSGNIQVQNAIKTGNLDCSISGSGNINVPSVTADKITSKISGSGNISFSAGTINIEDFSISGSGDIWSDNLLSSRSSAKISGSGNIVVNVLEELNVSISGSGNVKYRGKPTVNSQISGSGRLVHLD